MKIISIAAAALCLSAGCDRESVKVYHVDDSSAPAAASTVNADNGQAPMANATSPAPELKYILPAGWQPTTPGEMRVASFAVTNSAGQPADVGVIPLPATGDELALVNMWRGQLQLPAATEADADKLAAPVQIAGDDGKIFDLASAAPLIDGKLRARILVAELNRGGTSWFFKMTGEDAFVESQKENFLQFLKSVSFAPPPVNPAIDPGSQNILTPNANTIVTGDPKNNSLWAIPADWKQIDPGAMLLAKFSIASGDENASVNVSSLAGEGGGLAANLNRWRGQLGLPPLAQEEEFSKMFSSIDSPNGKIQIVDFTGTDSKTGKSARLVGAIVPRNGQTWFYKLMGDENIVARQKDAFIKFIQSAKYPDAP